MIEFYDASDIWRSPDVPSLLCNEDVSKLRMHESDRRICFRPVVTHPSKQVEIAFIGLNAYVREDYREVVRLHNFFVAKQDGPFFSKQLKPMLGIYCTAYQRAKLGDGTGYYTIYLKVVPPADEFGPRGGSKLNQVLQCSPRITEVMDRLLGEEIGKLVANGCRAFVSFGNDAADAVLRVITSQLDPDQTLVSHRLHRFRTAGTDRFLATNVHFAAQRPVVEESRQLATGFCHALTETR